MTRELNILMILAILTILLFAGWQILERESVLREDNFVGREPKRVNPTFPTELLPEI
ncbi:MAG: hypothetical protein WEC39_00465 [Patescibacteria group bacterium]